MKLYLRLWPFISKYWVRLFFVGFNVILFAVAQVYFMPFVKEVFYDIERQNIGLFVYRICAGILLSVIYCLSMFGKDYHMDWIGQRLVMTLRVRIYEHLQKLSLDFYSKWKVGEIMSRSTNDLQLIQNIMVANIVTLVPNVIVFFGVLIYLLILNWQLLLMTFVTLPLFAFLIQGFNGVMKRISSYNQRKLADIASILQESIYGIGIIKAFAAEKKEINKYTRENEQSFWISMKGSRLYAIQQPILFMLQVTMILLIIMVGGIQIIEGHITGGNFMAFCVGLGMLATPVMTFGRISTKQKQAEVALERIFELLDVTPSVEEKPAAATLPRIRGNVVFDNVRFAYKEADGEVLKGFDLKVQPGEVIALVGSSGSGKTTLVNLIPRFYDVSSGAITIDGQDVRNVTFQSLRSQIGIVTQETILFSGSIRDNITYGKDDATQAEIERAATMANAHNFIAMFPSKYGTMLGERGVRLSGGQKQRVAIARAILSDPRILILDEATSALDTESEKLVQQALETLMKGRTTFVIAHRLSTIINADRIVVLDEGKIAGIGTHAELLEKNEIYKKLYTIQFSGKK
jgi:subfamily B ATP-binding cassette protein MsbA